MAEGPLSDRLKSLGVRIGARDLPPPRPRANYPIEQVANGAFRPTSLGEVFVVEADYEPEHRHGNQGLRAAAPLGAVARCVREPRLAGLSDEHLVFLDTETTGLSGGTGTFAFLVGLGWHTGDGFRLAQFFMREPIEEPALLAAVAGAVSGRAALVTFNGKGFDAPLLNARYLLNGMTSPLSGLPHVDLLSLARRLWRLRLPSRALSALETQILGAVRAQDDVPGWMIPGLYFDYLRTGDARPLAGVFYHNAMDIVALAALLNHVSGTLSDPLNAGIEHGQDLIDLGALFEDLGEWETAASLYEQGLMHDLPETLRKQVVRRLAVLQRRRGCLEEAVGLWQEAAKGQQVYAHVELAKHYEHRMRDYAEAARHTQAAIDMLATSRLPRGERARWQAELTHRLERLQRRLGRSPR
jgi:uncharacterized protein YprB with RNaseH-like and TPR domain